MASEIRYCPVCQDDVVSKMNVNWIILILLLLIGFVILGVIYFVYCFVSQSHRKCPVCGCTTLAPPKMNKINEVKE